MPVSPQDFALWSRMTGNPIPTSPAERMAVAPQVYNMSRGLGRKGGIRSALGETVKSIGSTAARAGALMALGALAEGVDFPAQREEEKPEAEVVEISLDRPPAPIEERGAEFKVETPRAVTGISLDRPVVGIQERGPEFHVAPAREEVSLASGLSTRERAESFISGLQLGAKLQLDDEVAVDNDVIASNPASNTALASQDITSADPASAIGQRISSNQTSAAVAERSAAAPKQTVASKLSQQQNVVHLEEADNELVGAPAPGAAEAFRKGRQYQEMKQRYEGLQDIASPGTEGVSSTDVLPTVQRSTPVPTAQPAPRGASPAEIAELDAVLARGMSTTPEAERIAIRNRQLEKKYGAAPAVVTEQVEVAKPAGQVVVELDAPASARSAEFLAKYTTPKESKSPVREVTFGPGSEMEVNMRGRRYPYAAQDPFREAVGAYMSGEEQGQMGSAGSILTASGFGPKTGLMQKVGPEGVPVQNQASYRDFPGYMDEKQVQKVMASKGKSTEAKKAQAQRHVESKLLMRAMEKRAAERTAARGASTETFSGPAALAALRGVELG